MLYDECVKKSNENSILFRKSKPDILFFRNSSNSIEKQIVALDPLNHEKILAWFYADDWALQDRGIK